MKKTSNFKNRIQYMIPVLLLLAILSGCKDTKKEETKVSKVGVTVLLPNNEPLEATISNQSVIRFKIDSTLYGIAISDINMDQKDATIAFLEADELEEGIKIVPKEKIKVVANKKGVASLKVENSLGVFEVQLNDFSIGSFDPSAAAGSCCVTCGNTTACGCAVTMSCGSCCAGSCCRSSDVSIPSMDPTIPDFDFFIDTL